eukprot:5470495-Prymnesium_polylepis.1
MDGSGSIGAFRRAVGRMFESSGAAGDGSVSLTSANVIASATTIASVATLAAGIDICADACYNMDGSGSVGAFRRAVGR